MLFCILFCSLLFILSPEYVYIQCVISHLVFELDCAPVVVLAILLLFRLAVPLGFQFECL